MKQLLLSSSLFLTAAGFAHEDMLIVPIVVPCKTPISPPEIPYGCTRQLEVTSTYTVDDYARLQFQSGEWGQGVSEIRVFGQDLCQPTFNDKWVCEYTWPVPEGVWFWNWAIDQQAVTLPKCVHN